MNELMTKQIKEWIIELTDLRYEARKPESRMQQELSKPNNSRWTIRVEWCAYNWLPSIFHLAKVSHWKVDIKARNGKLVMELLKKSPDTRLPKSRADGQGQW